MMLREILQSKGSDIFSVSADGKLREVVRTLCDRRCGALVVIEGERMVGVISERDILRTIDQTDQSLDEIPIRDRMTKDVITGSPEDSVRHAMGVMTEHRIRHLPVLDGEKLIGMISIGDLVKAEHHQLSVENHQLMNYIHEGA